MNPIDLAFMVLLVPVVVLWALAPKKGAHWSGAWLLTIAPLLLPMAEDGFLAVWYSLVPPEIDPHGVSGVVEPHAAGHMFGAGVATILLSIVCAWVARRPLVRREPWAWKLLFGVGCVVVAVAVVELVFFFDHGLPVATLGEQGGFGWPPWIAGILAWGVGLWLTRPVGDRHKPIEEGASSD